MELTFRRSELGDIVAAQKVYRRIIDHLGETEDFARWHAVDHPRPEEVQSWVEAGELYSALDEDGEIAGVVVLNHDAVQEYWDAKWAIEASPEEVLIVHALGVAPDYLRRGVARFLLDSTIEVAKAKGCRAIRLDTYVKNVPAQKLYSQYGFTDLGEHTLNYEGIDLDRFHLFEYVL